MYDALSRSLFAVFFSLLLVALSFGSGKAQEDACTSDVEKLCKGVEPGGGRVLACLKEHKSELSPECSGYIAGKVEELKGKVDAWKQACGKYAEQFCKDVSPGQGRVLDCLKQHKDELSQECKGYLGP